MLQNFCIGFFIIFGIIGLFSIKDQMDFIYKEDNAFKELFINASLGRLFLNYMGALFILFFIFLILCFAGWIFKIIFIICRGIGKVFSI